MGSTGVPGGKFLARTSRACYLMLIRKLAVRTCPVYPPPRKRTILQYCTGTLCSQNHVVHYPVTPSPRLSLIRQRTPHAIRLPKSCHLQHEN
eukprot:1152054-Pelagomonas_calceolata.AAC.1